jgi:hypothetical protein
MHVHIYGGVFGGCRERHDLCVVLHRSRLDEVERMLALLEPTQLSVMRTAAIIGTSSWCLSRFESLLRMASGSWSGGFQAAYGCTRSISVRSFPLMLSIIGAPITLNRHSSVKIGNLVLRDLRALGEDSS